MACRTQRAKRELVRVVRAAHSGTLGVDLRGKASGRGAYLCADPACLERAVAQGSLARALESRIDEGTRERLQREIEEAMTIRKEGSNA